MNGNGTKRIGGNHRRQKTRFKSGIEFDEKNSGIAVANVDKALRKDNSNLSSY